MAFGGFGKNLMSNVMEKAGDALPKDVKDAAGLAEAAKSLDGPAEGLLEKLKSLKLDSPEAQKIIAAATQVLKMAEGSGMVPADLLQKAKSVLDLVQSKTGSDAPPPAQ